MGVELWKCTAVQLREQMWKGVLTAEELVRHYLERIARFGGSAGLNCVAELDETALAQARALDGRMDKRDLPLFGLPVLVKDNIDVKGLHTTAGSLALDDHVAAEDAPVVCALREKGAVVLGKANMTEFANYVSRDMPNGYSSRGGQVVHEYERGWDVSGSSSGSAVAVAAGLCAAALGTDTSFSVVGCASEHGVVGWKPPVGALSARGVVPLAHTLDSVGVLARTTEDALLIYTAMREEPLGRVADIAPGELRLAVNGFKRELVSEGQMARYEGLLGRLRDAGARIGEVMQPYAPQQRVVMRWEFMPDVEAYLAGKKVRNRTLGEIRTEMDTRPAEMKRYGDDLLREAWLVHREPGGEAAYREALAARDGMRRELLVELEGFDACLMTGPTNCMHFAGLPSVCVPFDVNEKGIPCGAILYGADERRLAAAARVIERFAREIPLPVLD